MSKISRRTVIGTVLYASGVTSLGALAGCGEREGGSLLKGDAGANSYTPPPDPPVLTKTSLLEKIGDLLPPDKNGVMLPTGFTSRIIARSGERPVSSSSYIWHGAPDGAAIFETETGGWIYASNSELKENQGGVGALVFNAKGEVIDAYSMLTGTNKNCAGGATPWGTWLSCEETALGSVWECDPKGILPAVNRPALGLFNHEAVAINPKTNILYMTEDRQDGLFYRFIADAVLESGRPDLSSGKLQAAIVDSSNNSVTWADIQDPSAATVDTRQQVPWATTFNGAEGMVHFANVVSFVTKGDNRIWAYQTDNEVLSVIYDKETSPNPILSGVDNVTISHDGELIISEDGGDLQVVAITALGRLLPLAQLVGHEDSEVTGPAFSPDGTRLYFSSQRGTGGTSGDGLTYEITGPFHRTA